MSYKQQSELPVIEGGTEVNTFTAYTPVTGGTTSTGALQSVASLGTSGQVLTSTGSSSLPTFQDPPTGDTTVVFPPIAGDPSSPSDADVWFDTVANSFQGQATIAMDVWTAKTGISTATRGLAAAGQQVDGGIIFGGFTTVRVTTCEQYDEGGNSWSSLGSMNTAQLSLAGGGSSDDALSVGGDVDSDKTERYDSGTNSWTNKANCNTGAQTLGATGSSGADILKFGGNTGAATAVTERYDGGADSWTNKTSMNTARFSLQVGGSGDAGDALSIGGYTGTGAFTTTELYEGVGNTWTAKTGLNTGMRNGASAGIGAGNALSCGGNNGSGISAICERYDRVANTWTVIESLNTARQQDAGLGTSTSALTMGGFTSVNVNTVEQYDGSSGSTTITFNVT